MLHNYNNYVNTIDIKTYHQRFLHYHSLLPQALLVVTNVVNNKTRVFSEATSNEVLPHIKLPPQRNSLIPTIQPVSCCSLL